MTWRGLLGRGVLPLTALALMALPHSALAQGGPPPVVREAVDVVVRYVSTGDAESLRALRGRLAGSFMSRFADEDALLAHLRGLDEAVAGPVMGVDLERDPEGLLIRLEGPSVATLRMALDEAAGRITELRLASQPAAAATSGDAGPREAGPAGSQAMALEAHLDAMTRLYADAEAAEMFVRDRMTPELASSRPRAETVELLRTVGRLAAAAMVMQVERTPEEFVVTLRGQGSARVRLRLGEAAPHRLSGLSLETDVAAAPEPAGPAWTWDTLEERLEAATADGFAGSVLAIRDGRVVLDRGFGPADPATGRPNTPETIFDIGSIPIDFTRAAVLLLWQEGHVSLDDPIGRFFPDVPADKSAITLRHLLERTSGLPNFHHEPGDADPDLTWVDRATAERRILGRPLLFLPGTGEAPSHSAYGLLAAVVERTSGVSYEEFLRERFFRPAGMTRTGPYGEALGLVAGDFAVGGGPSRVGDPNIPPNWGRTSWLIKGSGGMVSTTGDMRRWFELLRSGRVLGGEALRVYLDRGSAVGATDRGFFFLHAWAGADTMVFLAQNAGPRGPGGGLVGEALVDLVRAGSGR